MPPLPASATDLKLLAAQYGRRPGEVGVGHDQLKFYCAALDVALLRSPSSTLVLLSSDGGVGRGDRIGIARDMISIDIVKEA